mmetsp:Transcript_23074/g.49131  ORF Transcript_23074/g.49131 Transcript_23074/m.49131 type:complete len:150 (-) Transcript_23074:1846-2295(-)
MHKELEAVYEEGDEVFIIGFSRGSASARTIACELNEKRIPVKFFGCFDTVSMQVYKYWGVIIGNAFKKQITSSSVLKEIDGIIPENVERAVQCLSLDDTCYACMPPFPPIIMDSEDPRVHESYFPGTHKFRCFLHTRAGMARRLRYQVC